MANTRRVLCIRSVITASFKNILYDLFIHGFISCFSYLNVSTREQGMLPLLLSNAPQVSRTVSGTY